MYCSYCKQILYIVIIIEIMLKYKGYCTNVVKEQCNDDMLHCDNNDSVKTTVSKNEQMKEKYNPSDILILKFHDTSELTTEDKAVVQKLYSVKGITWGEYVYCCNGYVHIRIRIWN